MYYIGIDIAKRVHVCALLDESNTVVIKPFRFTNDKKGFKKLLIYLGRLACERDDLIIGMEATGSLFENLYRHKESLFSQIIAAPTNILHF